MLGTAAALGAGIMLAPGAQAADKWGPGFLIPDASGKPDTSHIGAYGAPGKTLPGVSDLAYCADPELAGPDAAGQYGPVKEFTTWISQASAKSASAEDVARAAYVLSKYGQTKDDMQAAAVDAVVYSYLEAGTTYALPDGKRALQRLGYPNVPPDAKKFAAGYMNEAKMFAGPYKINIKPAGGPLKPGGKTEVTLDVTSATGHKVPGVKLDINVAGAASGVTTNADGVATTTVTAGKDTNATVKVTAKSLPGSALRAITPSNSKAQRMLLAGGTSSAEAQLQLKVDALQGSIKIVKTAADTGKTLAGVEFQIKDDQGKTVATGKTDASGFWQANDLAPGKYTVHEVKAVEGYQLAPDQTTTVTDSEAAEVAVKDVKIPTPETPKPRPVKIPELPKTGA
ncbi:SpaA isopeptide-forming pilin-related protein [Streptomyces sp. NPDC059835]|uniref:SpaA isopeptide-forming pilin-related protein n=1 Tax=Streptomyces sp. NPDC059835 TaxID=3346967 RepID=UPI003650A3DE